MSREERKALAAWVEEKDRKFDSQSRLYNVSALALSALDAALGILAAFYTVLTAGAVLTSIICAATWGSRFIQLVKLQKLVKAVEKGYFYYIKKRKNKEESKTMKRIIQNIKNNPITLVAAFILAVVMGFAGYIVSQASYGHGYDEWFVKAETEQAEVLPGEDDEPDEEEPGETPGDDADGTETPSTGMTDDPEGELQPEAFLLDTETETAETEDSDHVLESALIGAATFILIFVLICLVGWDGIKEAALRKLRKKLTEDGVTEVVEYGEAVAKRTEAEERVAEELAVEQSEVDLKIAEAEEFLEECKKEEEAAAEKARKKAEFEKYLEEHKK